MKSVKMSEKPDKKSASHISKTVKIIRKRAPKDFISQKRAEINRRIQHVKRSKPGIVKLSHIPPGFYENEIQKYFEQFGDVTKVKLARSKKTGRTQGYAYIEFEHSVVADIVAETMNNYLLFNRLLKAKVVDKCYKGMWEKVKLHKIWKNRGKALARKSNKERSPAEQENRLRARLFNLDDMIEKLKAKGINYSYKPAIRQQIEDSCPGKFVMRPNCDDESNDENEEISQEIEDESNITINNEKAVLEVDESDDEIMIKTPPNAIKRKLASTANQSLCLNSSVLKKLEGKSRKGDKSNNFEKKKIISLGDVMRKLKEKNKVLNEKLSKLKNERSNELIVTEVKEDEVKSENEHKSKKSNDLKVTELKEDEIKIKNERKSKKSSELKVKVIKKPEIKTQNEIEPKPKSEKKNLNKLKRKGQEAKTQNETSERRKFNILKRNRPKAEPQGETKSKRRKLYKLKKEENKTTIHKEITTK